MISRFTIAKSQPFPTVLKYTDIRSYVFTFVFVSLSVLVPWGFHQFHLAGPTFLPMHIFVFIAGLLFGWRAGLVVGLLTPLASHAVSGLPALPIVPQIVVELSAYGTVCGILREKFNLQEIWALLGAMISGRLALCLAVLTIYLIVGESYSPLGLEANPFTMVWSVIKQGWPGIVIQLALIPTVVWLVRKFAVKNTEGRQP